MLYWALMFLIIAIIAGFLGLWRDRVRRGRHCKDTVFYLPGRLRRDAADGFDGQKKPAYLMFKPNTRFAHHDGRVFTRPSGFPSLVEIRP